MWRCIAVSLVLGSVLWGVDSRQPAPSFRATTINGQKLTKETLKGKPVLIQFWTTWCGYCRRDQPAVDDLTKRFEPQGLVVLAVNVGEGKQKVKDFLTRSPRTPQVVLTEDTNLTALFPPDGFPLYVLIDQTGKIAGRQEGAGGEAALLSLLAKVGFK